MLLQTIIPSVRMDFKSLPREKRPHSSPLPPEGGISVRAAATKYNLTTTTISRWASKGIVTIVSKTPNWTYISEKEIAQLADKYHRAPGRGKRAHLKENN
jgi:hypothetical protein